MSVTDISTVGEFGLIRYLTQNIELYNVSTILGVGDDAAVIDHLGKQTLLTSDMMVEGIHFDLVYTPLKHLGYKSVVVNLSDIYAMGGMPTQILVSLAIGSKYTVEALSEIYEGIYLACDYYKVDLVGGDTCSSTKDMVISVTAIGEVTPDAFIKRSTAAEHDLICVTGDLGGAFLGLTILEREKKVFEANRNMQPDLKEDEYAIRRLLKPEARGDMIEWMREQGLKPTAMIDVSDGISSDMLHICKESGVGCMIYEHKIPIADAARQSAYKLSIDPTTCALHGGEDYELLFTIKQSDYEKIKDHQDINVIGHITKESDGYNITTKSNNVYPLTAQGWNAFTPRNE